MYSKCHVKGFLSGQDSILTPARKDESKVCLICLCLFSGGVEYNGVMISGAYMGRCTVSSLLRVGTSAI